MLVVNPADLTPVRAAATRALASATEISGLTLRLHPVLEVYPTVPMFRDATGEPGWVAASTRANRVRLEPPGVLGSRLQAVLRHEFLHLLVESNAKANTPLWFREGLVVYLTGGLRGQARRRLSPDQIDETIRVRRSQVEMENAYAAAAALVADLDQRWCRAEGAPHLPASGKCGSPWLRWLRDGLPDGVGAPPGARFHEVP